MAIVLGVAGAIGLGILSSSNVARRWLEARRSAPAVVADRPAPTAMPDPPPLEVSADKLRRDYTGNEIAADQRYRGRLLRVTGVIETIGYTLGEPHMKLLTNEFETVDAWFDLAWKNDLARLHAGDQIAVRCVGGGMVLRRPQLQRCWPESR